MRIASQQSESKKGRFGVLFILSSLSVGISAPPQQPAHNSFYPEATLDTSFGQISLDSTIFDSDSPLLGGIPESHAPSVFGPRQTQQGLASPIIESNKLAQPSIPMESATPQAPGLWEKMISDLQFLKSKLKEINRHIVAESLESRLIPFAILFIPAFFLMLIAALPWRFRKSVPLIKSPQAEELAPKKTPRPPVTLGLPKDNPFAPTEKPAQQPIRRSTYADRFNHGDLQSMFHAMSIEQALDFLKPLSPEDRQSLMDKLELRGPVKQLVIEELGKRS